MNGETTQHLAQVKHSATEEVVSEDDDVPLAQRKQKPVGKRRPRQEEDKACILSLKVKPEPNRSPVKKSPSSKSHPAGGVVKKEVPSPAKQAHSASRHAASDDDDDVPLAARTQHKHPVTKVKTEPKVSASKPVKSALNSVVDEKKTKAVKPEKVKNGKPVKPEKKVDKKLDGAKKHDSVKKEKKPDSGKAVKKQVDSDDDEPLVRFKGTLSSF
ncbi:hypothetical protein OS493_005084 [Desmophyllum pertusum]|uniref:Uncharacterized protein n=1 Tax=Desmophyllum pertusum TaxID=174260 RepID=A0A9W9Z466_9CNID|nr:hypothetical protein OS493_005084 [Desmophyllum pertusum]